MYQGLSSLQASMLSSALEHTVPEQMFSTATQKAQAVSTVKLLNLAAQQGIPILHITPANSAITIPTLQLAPAVITEIQTAVAVGKEVIVHQNNITAFGWTGAGYAILDPVTGDAAWRISGGGNGAAYAAGVSVGSLISVLVLMSTNPTMAIAATNPAILGAMIGGILAITGVVALYSTLVDDKHGMWKCYLGAIMHTLTFSGLMVVGSGLILPGVLGWFGFIVSSLPITTNPFTCLQPAFEAIWENINATR